MEIDITALFNEQDAFNYSHSRAEGGTRAGENTWRAAKERAASEPMPLTTPEHFDALRQWAKETGAWDESERNAWTDEDCNALFIQLVSGDMREAGLDNDPDDDAWLAYTERAQNGEISGNIFQAADGKVYYELS